MSFEQYNQEIKNSINHTDVVYIGIGTSMSNYKYQDEEHKANEGYHRIITETNHQQHPIFLNRFQKKVIILFDTELENPLKIEQYYAKKGNLLILRSSAPRFRVLDNNECIVFAINDYFEGQINFISMITAECLRVNSKLILQGFTGYDYTYLYSNLLSTFPKEQLLPNVLFDVTCGDGDCLTEFTEFDCSMDNNRNFINENFQTILMCSLVASPFLNKIIDKRLKILINYLTSPHMGNKIDKKYEYLFQVYDIPFTPEAHAVNDLIRAIIYDIVETRGCEPSIAELLIAMIGDRSKFINKMSILGYM